MRKFALYLAVVATVLSLLVHLVTFIPSVPITMVYVVPVFLLISLVYVLLVNLMRKAQPASPTSANTITETWERQHAESAFVIGIIKQIPRSVQILAAILIAYVALTFFLMFQNREGGTPEQKNGQAYLSRHDQKIRDLTPYEYQRMQAYDVRCFSALLLLISPFPALTLAYDKHGRRQENS